MYKLSYKLRGVIRFSLLSSQKARRPCTERERRAEDVVRETNNPSSYSNFHSTSLNTHRAVVVDIWSELSFGPTLQKRLPLKIYSLL